GRGVRGGCCLPGPPSPASRSAPSARPSTMWSRRCGARSCTRSATTSASTTPASPSSAGDVPASRPGLGAAGEPRLRPSLDWLDRTPFPEGAMTDQTKFGPPALTLDPALLLPAHSELLPPSPAPPPSLT